MTVCKQLLTTDGALLTFGDRWLSFGGRWLSTGIKAADFDRTTAEYLIKCG
ncbi:MAG TPA: hypothetical protein VKA68_16625 [bacterium]|nr:hypothetical protein [bacterium]